MSPVPSGRRLSDVRSSTILSWGQVVMAMLGLAGAAVGGVGAFALHEAQAEASVSVMLEAHDKRMDGIDAAVRESSSALDKRVESLDRKVDQLISALAQCAHLR
jgi:hypothetical protein